MKFIYSLILLLFIQHADAQKFTNKGKEFWVGYGQNALFTANTQSMLLYLSADVPATVTVSINGTTWTRTYNIPANTVTVSDVMPKTGAEDCRLITEGLYTKGIHIVSDVPIAAFVHTYGQYSSGGTMLLPVDSYSYSYVSVNSEITGSDLYSWFYVVASENNTKVRITPTRATVGNRAINVPFEVTLNKGEIYNVMAKVITGGSNDISGSKVQSIPGADGTCHPVALFSGCSRAYVCPSGDPLNTGSDYMMQQVFPTNAWGSRFITALTSRSTGANNLNNNKFRAYIRDPNTLVRKNGVLVTGLLNNACYDFLSTTGDVITSNKPILLAQFIPSANGCGSEGLGDPEMFCLVPVEQAIDKISFFSSSRENIEANYLTLIIPTNGVPSLRIDGASNFDYTYPHPNAPGYTVVVKQFLVPNLQHTAKSDSAFTAIAYGLGQFESYGYNAGAHVDNLEAVVQLKNEYAPTYSAYTCTKTPFHPVLKTVYKPSSIFWPLSTVSGLSPNANVTVNNPVPTDSVTENGRKYYMYQLPGDYYFNHIGADTIPVTLTNLLTENCTYSVNTYLSFYIKPAPTANFTVAPVACLNDTISFVDASPNATLIKRWNWNFGDGTIDSAASPTKNYTLPGSYNVKMQIIKKDDGCVGDTIKPIVIQPSPVAAFMLPQNICMPNGNAVFTNLSTFPAGNATTLTYDWNFGDGNNSTVKDPTHGYANNGPFTVVLKATSPQGCSDTSIQVLSSFNTKPVAAFTLPQNICMPNGDAIFTNSSTLPNGNASSLTYDWNFGDGNHATSTSPTHIYGSNGPFTVVLKAVSPQGCVDSSTQVLSSFLNKPVAAFTLPQNICMPNGNAIFANNSTLPNGNATSLTYDWNFGDGNHATSTSPTHIYGSNGPFTVVLKAVSPQGCVDSSTQVLSSFLSKPVAAFTLPQNICMPNGDAIFTNSSTLPNGNTSSLTYDWNFGDGNHATSTSPTHIYGSNGPFTVVLKAVSPQGCVDSSTQVLSSFLNKPVAAFTLPQNICMPNGNAIFANNSTLPNGNASTLTYDWNFGDGNHSATTSPTHIYGSNGPFTVVLKAVSPQGCVDSSMQVLSSFLSKPVAAFTLPQNICMPNGNAIFTNSSTLPNGNASSLTYDWNFGDGNHATTVNSTHVYGSNGPFTVVLKAISAQGCVDSSTQVLSSFIAKPLAAFTLPQNICVPNGNANFINSSTLPSGNAASLVYDWNFGDGNHSTTTNPSHVYGSKGPFTVVLKATSPQGCADSSLQVLSSFIDKPLAAFTLPQNICMPNGDALFANTSTLPNGNASTLTYDWNFGDGNHSGSANPTHVYASNGPFTVVLKASSPAGCVDSSTQILSSFSNKPAAAFDVPSKLCVGDAVFLTDKSTGNVASWQWGSGNGAVSSSKVPQFIYTQPGTYIAYLTVGNASGCVSDTIKHILVIADKPQVDAGPSLTMRVGGSIILQGSVSDPTLNIQWTPSLYLNNSGIATPTSTTPVSQLYLLTVSGQGNCTATDTMYVRVLQDIKIPNAFTPNGDGMNDVWRIPFLIDYPLATLEIYNRWGQSVYKQTGNPKPWDGKLNGTLLPIGAYYYIIDTKDGANGKYSGSVLLIR